jgi:subtilisin family serine protease
MNIRTRALFALFCVCLITQPALAGEKIESITDLPVRTYPIDVPPSQLIHDAAAMDALRAQVKSDVEGILEKYDIEDTATLQRFYGVLGVIAMWDGRHDDAIGYVEKVRELEEKESARYMGGLNTLSVIDASKIAEPGTDEFKQAFQTSYAERLAAMPWDVVQDAVQSSKGMEELRTEKLMLGFVEANMDPVVAETGELNDEMAEGLVGMQVNLREFMPLREQRLAVLTEMVAAHTEEKENIWPARAVTLDADAGYAPLVVGIWDSGVDANVFGKETYNGLDDDGNGFVDDFHGIAFDMFGREHPELLHPHGDMTGQVEASMQYMKGLSDVQSAIDSPEASELKAYIGSLEPSEVSEFLTALGFTALYMHGTHVAGIAVEGNPFAEILVARISFDYHSKPAPILLEAAKQHADSYARTVKYFQTAGVRVVNMSWGWTFNEVQSSLEANGIGETAEERQAMTEKIFGTLDRGLHDAMASAPEILFVIAAGNDDSDVAFDRTIPSAYELPNILVVGAVDQAGERTGFTSMGENVVVYANGFEVESYVPGGARQAANGTSMASPNAANLAAKLFTVDPELSTNEVISLIVQGADELEDGEGLKLLNPAQSMALLLAEQQASK